MPTSPSAAPQSPLLPAPTTRRKLLVRGAIGVVVTGGLFALLARFIDWRQVGQLMRAARPDGLAAAFGLYLAIYAVRAWRFRLMAPRTPVWTMFFITCVHNFLLRLLPMRTGDLSYAFLVRRAGTAGLGHGVITLILIRLFDAASVVVLFGLTLALNRGVYHGDARPGFIAAGAVLVLGAASVIYFRTLLRAGLWLLVALAGVLGLERRPRVERLVGQLRAAVESFAETPPSLLLWVMLATGIQWILNFAVIFAIMRAFSLRVTVAQAVLGGTAAVVSGFLPIGGIGSFGALEAGWTLGFALVGLETSVAVATALGFSVVTLVFGAGLGLVGWIGLGLVGRRARRSTGP